MIAVHEQSISDHQYPHSWQARPILLRHQIRSPYAIQRNGRAIDEREG